MMCICMYDMHMIRLEEDDVISRYVHIHILIIYMHEEGPCPFLRTQAAKYIFSLMPVKLLRMRLRLIRSLLLPFFVLYIYIHIYVVGISGVYIHTYILQVLIYICVCVYITLNIYTHIY